MLIPSLILKQMYTLGSLENVEDGVRFSLKNRLSNATLTRVKEIRIDGQPVPADRLTLELHDSEVTAASVTPDSAVAFPLARVVRIHARGAQLEKGPHEISLAFETEPFGSLSFKVKDAIAERVKRTAVPTDKENDQTPEIIRARQKFVEEYSGVQLQHIDKFSFDPAVDQGQHRELHRRGPDPHRLRRAAQGQRRACPGRVPDPPRHHRGHPRRLLQPRHEGAQPLRRRHVHRGRATACSARRSSSSRTPARAATS